MHARSASHGRPVHGFTLVELAAPLAGAAARILPGATLAWAVLAAGAAAQDLYKSRAEMMNAEALNKQANATIINAMAGYGKTQAEVAKLNEETYEKAVQNDLLESKVYYEKQAQYHTHRGAHRPQPATSEQLAARARRAAPVRLSTHELWSQPGALRWPTLLKGQFYDHARNQIDDLLANRTDEDSGAGSLNCHQVQALVDELRAALAARVRQYRSSDYLVARKFLEAVAREAQEPVYSVSKTVDKVAGH